MRKACLLLLCALWGNLLFGQCPPSSAVLAPLVEDFTSQTVPLIGNAAGVNLSSCWTLFSGSSSASFRWETEDATGGNENSSGTGPFFDATSFGVAGGKYLYLETSLGTPGDSAYFVSPSIDISGLNSAELRFAYHMYGASMGSLAVQVNDGSGWTNAWSLTGQQQTAGNDPWLEAVVDLSTYNSPLTVRFTGVRGTSFRSDMSIDDVSIGDALTAYNPHFAYINNRNCVVCDQYAVGDTFSLDSGATWYTVVDRALLEQKRDAGDDLSKVCVSLVTDMSNMFQAKTAFNDNISGWDVSNVTDMEYMFLDAQTFNDTIGNWDVSNVNNMAFMFKGAHTFNQSLNQWDVSAVSNMRQLFFGASSFNSPIDLWNVSGVINMQGMFQGAAAFNQPIGGWEVASVINMQGMFQGAAAFNQPIGGWEVASVTNMNSMFYNTYAFDQDLSGWCVNNISSLPTNFAGNSALQSIHYPQWGSCPCNIVLDLGPDTVAVCGSSYTLDAGDGYNSYAWSTGATTRFITVSSSGLYSCTVSNSACAVSDTLFVNLLDASITASDSVVCAGESVQLSIYKVVATPSAITQLGLDIDGEAGGDFSGRSVSMPDANTVAIGAQDNDGNVLNSGHVRIYSWNGASWVQKGGDIDGEAAYDRSGLSVSMPDANTVAIGAPHNDGNGSSSGHVRVYSWNGASWVQKGGDIDGEAAYDLSGYSVSMPDANTVAIGANYNDGNGSNAGHVRVYNWNGTSWVQKGVDIDGEAAGDESGSSSSVSMPDANTVAIGAPWNGGNGSYSGHVRIYSWNGTSWVQKGVDIDGEAAVDLSGYSVSMPDANTVAIGAPHNDGNGSSSGHVRIYSWNGTSWVQKGGDIDGEAADDRSGISVSMPDANTVAIGAPYNGGNGSNSGHVRIYSWNGISWVQKSADIDGEAADDWSGESVSMPDANTVAIGAANNDGNVSNAGHVRVYSLPASGPSITYLWSTGDTTATITANPTQTTTYYCTVSDGISTCTDSVTVYVNPLPALDLGLDTVLVCGGNYTLDAGAGFSSYLWSTGDSTQTTTISSSGMYSCTVGDNGCFSTDSVYISLLDASITASDSVVCAGDSVQLSVYKVVATPSAITQLGLDIDGETAGDYSGYSVSMPDANTVAIGAMGNDGNGAGSGHVRIYGWNGTSWVQKGVDIDGEAAGDQSGYSVSMPDANTVAIGAPNNDGNGSYSGHVRIYSWNGTSWVQKGVDIDGEVAVDLSGYSVSMPDANTVTIGAYGNSDNGSYSGHVRVYSWNGASWVQKGVDIDGEAADDQSGWSVSMPDANTVAIGAPNNDGNGSYSGHVRIYNWNGTSWVQKGLDIDGEAAVDLSAWSVSMPDANTVAIGAQYNDGNGSYSGHVRIYNWNGTSWVQKGLDIDGEAAGEQSGWSVSMPDANTVAIGAIGNDGNGAGSGHVRIYGWNGTSWVQKGVDIDGEAVGDQSGWSVSMPDANTVAIGAPYNDGNGTDAGHTRVYSIPAPASNTVSYLWSTGDTTASITANPSQTTTYYCTVSDGISTCTDSVTVYVKETPSATILNNYRVDLSWINRGAALYNVWFRMVGDLMWSKVNSPTNARSLYPLAPGSYEYYISEVGNVNPSCIGNFTINCEDFGYSVNTFQIVDATKGKVNVFGVTGGRRTWDFALDDGTDTTWLTNSFSRRFLNLDAGTYNIYVKDNYNCYSSQVVTVTIDPLDSSVIPVLTTVQNLGGGNLRPMWTVSDPTRIDRYQVRVKDMTSGGLGTLYQTYIVLGGTTTSFTINGLPPARYRIDVRGSVDGAFANGIYSNYRERIVSSNKDETTNSTELSEENQIILYPNPTNDLLYVQAPEGSELELLDMNGKRIALRSTKSTEEVFDLRELAQGVYILQISSNGILYRERVVKN